MKPIQMEFIENQRWRWIWSVAILCGLALLGSAMWRSKRLEPAIHAESERLGAVQLRLQQLRLPVQHKGDPRHISWAQAAQLLQFDPNRAFTTVENLQERDIGLRSLSLEAASNRLRLEYEVDSLVKAAAVTELLNAGYELRPWQLESVHRTGPVNAAGALPMGSETASFRGIWSVQLNQL